MKKQNLNQREQELLIDHLNSKNEHHSLIILLLALTGVRCHELWNIKLGDLNFETGDLTIWKAAKGSDGRVLGLPKWYVSRARGKVDFRRGPKYRLVESLGYEARGGTVKSFKSALRRSWAKTKRELWGETMPLGLHSLRHTFAVKMYEATMDPVAVQRTLGHKCFSSTERYLHYSNEAKQIAASRGLYENVS